jgi:hypothetical protein
MKTTIKHPSWRFASRVALAAALTVSTTPAVGTARAESNARPQAERLVAELEVHAKDPEVARLLARAKDALRRAAATPPTAASTALEAAALQWARAAASWVELGRAEAEAAEQERALAELRAQVKHVRAQLEETDARRSRAAGLLMRTSAPSEHPEAPPAASDPEPTPKQGKP